MSGVKIKVKTFRAPADITAPGALAMVLEQAELLADTLYLEREGLPGNLSVHAQSVLRLAPLAATDARAAAQLGARIGDINRLFAIWPSLKTLEASKNHGSHGGKASKRRRWAELAAGELASLKKTCADDAWAALPATDSPWTIETDYVDFEIYADGDDLIAVNADSRAEIGSLKKSTFLKNYYRPAIRSGK